jgi:peptidoglycan/xylan/chitin deacetylase (PgdA/CDA1 family)
LKKALIVIIFIIIGLFAGGYGYAWVNANRVDSRTSPNKQPAEVQTPSSPQPQDTPPETVKPLEILGESDKLTEAQWAAMQQWRQTVQQMAATHPDSLYLNGSGAKKQVALTFDDGPDEALTGAVLDVLKQYEVTGTFFFKANQLTKYPAVVKRAYQEGNQIASHAYSHQELDKMSPADIEKEIVASDKAFEQVLGVQPAMIRPPFGAINTDVLQVCRNSGEIIILWSIDTLDWSQKEPDHIAKNVLNNVRPGDIILMHSCKDQEATVQALPQIIAGLQQKGYDLVDLATLLTSPAYKK